MQHCAVTHFLSYSSLGYAYFQNSPEAKSGYNTFFPYIGAFIFVSFISKKSHLFPKLTGEFDLSRGATDAYGASLERLSERVENLLVELGQFIQKQNAIVRQGDLARSRLTPSAN